MLYLWNIVIIIIIIIIMCTGNPQWYFYCTYVGLMRWVAVLVEYDKFEYGDKYFLPISVSFRQVLWNCYCGLYHGALNFLKSSPALCPRFSVCFSIHITSLGEEGAGLCASRIFVCLFCACIFLSFFSSSWCRVLAAVCDCGIPCSFLLTFFKTQNIKVCILLSSLFPYYNNTPLSIVLRKSMHRYYIQNHT